MENEDSVKKIKYMRNYGVESSQRQVRHQEPMQISDVIDSPENVSKIHSLVKIICHLMQTNSAYFFQ